MVKKNVEIVGIEVRKSVDATSKIATTRYYVHGIHHDATMNEGICTFSGKVPDDLIPLVTVGQSYDVVYRSYNGYNTCEGFYHA